MTNSQKMTKPTSVYRSYMVRFWQSNEEGCWRASAHCVQTGSTMLFGDVASLLAFLQSEVGETSTASTTEPVQDQGLTFFAPPEPSTPGS